MEAINNNELQRIAQFLTRAEPHFYEVVKQFCNDIYLTGCRPMELLTIDLWSVDTGDNEIIYLQPLKGNLQRTFPREMLSESLQFAIDNTIDPYNGLSLRQIEYSVKQVSAFGVVLTAERFAVVYLNRYNRVRTYLQFGATQSEVNDIFGWINPLMSTRYTDSQLYVYFDNIPAETYAVTNINNGRIIDSDGTIVIDAS